MFSAAPFSLNVGPSSTLTTSTSSHKCALATGHTPDLILLFGSDPHLVNVGVEHMRASSSAQLFLRYFSSSLCFFLDSSTILFTTSVSMLRFVTFRLKLYLPLGLRLAMIVTQNQCSTVTDVYHMMVISDTGPPLIELGAYSRRRDLCQTCWQKN